MFLSQSLVLPWSHSGSALLLPRGGEWGLEREGQWCLQSLLPQQEFGLAPEEGLLVSRGSTQEAGPSAVCIAESPSCTPQHFLMATCLSLRPQDETLRFLLDFMLSLDFRISPDLKICFLFALHRTRFIYTFITMFVAVKMEC